ncbi:MAG: M16 family metallopeptidase, partial [Alphaproteobacteria bacterium]
AQPEPWSIAQRLWWSAAFPAHPSGRRAAGTPDSVKSLTAADLQAQHRIAFSRDTLVVGVVGDITADQLKILLDRVFGALPATADRPKVATVAPVATGQIAVARRESSQSVVIFGHAGIARDDKDFYPAFVMNHLLGGGSFSSRLYMEIREKRGLAYSVSTSVSTLDHSNLLYGSVATKNERVKESIDLIRAEWRRMAEHGVTQSELDGAKAFLVRSYALRFSSSSAIASILVGVQLDKMDIDFFEKRNGYVEAVTVEDIKRVAARLLKADKLTFTVVGNPQGVDG